MKMIRTFLTATVFCTAAFLSAAGNPDSKNVIDSEYRPVPGDYWELIRREPGRWNANFRPYDPQSAEMLWSDSNLIRDVQLDVKDDKRMVTAITSFCDESGFSILIFLADPNIRKNLSEGKARPANMFEIFFEPGDADHSGMEHYYQFICQTVQPYIWGVFPWLMEDRTFRTVKGRLTVDVHHRPDTEVMHIRVPWDPLFDRLPFLRKGAENIWRLSVIRWASTGGQTWGGNVHQQSTAGYLRFPPFTEAQKTAIMKHVLVGGWDAFNGVLAAPRYSMMLLPVNSCGHFERDQDRFPHTFLVPAADKQFRESVMKQMIAERSALGGKIADFETLPYAEREAFYKTAAPMLYNFEYDLQQAWGKWQEDQIFAEKGE